MAKSKRNEYRIALVLMAHRSYGEGIARGVGQFMRQHANIRYVNTPGSKVLSWERMTRRRADGVIAHIATAEQFAWLQEQSIPAVNISNLTRLVEVPKVVTDEFQVGRLVAEDFLARGFRRFAFCGITDHLYSEERERGFRQTLREAGFDCASIAQKHYGTTDPDGVKRIADISAGILALEKPVAIMACNDMRAIQVVDACRNAGISVPDDVAVIGVDNDALECELSDVPISSVQLNAERIGYEAAAVLLRLMEGQPPPQNPILIPPVRVVTRRSSDVTAIEDQVIARCARFIREHAHEPIGVPDLLAHAALSRRAFETRFRAALGRSPYAEILRVRIERAKELLADSDLSVGEIATVTGFSEIKELSVVFHRKTGQTPTAYRRQFQLRDSTNRAL